MLTEESIIIAELLKHERNKKIINVCSSDLQFYSIKQPHIFEYVMKPLVQRKCQLINLDIKNGLGIDLVSDCTNMNSILKESFDIVLFCSAIEHISDPRKALVEILRILKPNGFLIASAPGIYPKHKDPIDTLLRMPNRQAWEDLINGFFRVEIFRKTKPLSAPKKYCFNKNIFATIIKARPIKEKN